MFYFVLSSLVVPRERALRTRLTRARTTQLRAGVALAADTFDRG